jgi:glutamate--cysteine ligase catalytic subunit
MPVDENTFREGVSTGFFTKIPPINGHSHFENLQSTNWNSLRFKSPPSEDSNIGWRVEFRPLDIQLTDFENAAYTVFVGMIANLINQFSLDFTLPISLVDENMLRCQEQDGILT